jgi:hypothetical protein
MSELLTNILKNIGCSYCQEYEYQENINYFKSWKLYLKEYEMYSAMILYNDKLNKDISHIIKKNDSIFLLNNKDIILKLEYISNESDNAILVPTDEYNDFYEKIEEMNKTFDEKIKAYYIGTFDIEKCK